MTHIAQLIAQVAPDPLSVLIAQGPLGVMLAWFLFRGERLAALVVREIGDMKETMLLDVASRPSASLAIREIAQDKLDTIEANRKR